MAPRVAWVLNLDADLELGAPDGYTPTNRVRLSMKPHAERFAALFLAPGDVLVEETSPPLSARGLPGRAFCPTPRALGLLRRAGARPEPHPSVDVLRRVNSRAFATSLGPTLPGAAFVTDLEGARAVLARDPVIGDAWRIKYAFGMTGRNQRVVPRGPLAERDLAFVALGLAQGGVQIEPNVALEEEYAVHGFLAADGSLRAGDLVRQRCDARGAWIETERLAPGRDAPADLRDRMNDELRTVARALFAAGYFGPFGVDGYAYRDRAGALCVQPRSEINARYSMGFAIGLPLARSDAP